MEFIYFATGTGVGVAGTFLWAFWSSGGKPCPAPLCKNTLPRQGAWNTRGHWEVEECPVCLAKIQFVSIYNNPAHTDSSDHYIRVHTPEAKP